MSTRKRMSAGLADGARRRLLGGAGALGSLALAGCAGSARNTSDKAPRSRVVVVGGGFGGATAARYLRLWGDRIEVTLIERQPAFVSCPMSNLVVGGYRRLSDVTMGYESLKALGVKVVQGEAVAIDAGARKLRLAGGAELGWDRLIVSPGIDFQLDGVAGLSAALDSGRVTHAWKAGAQTETLRRQLQDMRDGGVFVLSIPRTPYRCPPGPYERACLVASYLKQAKPRSKVLVLDANPEVQSKKALFEHAFKAHYAGMLEYRPNAELRGVDGLTARTDFDDVKADVLNVVPPQRAADLLRRAGLADVNGRWVDVDWLSLEARAAPGVHVLGDATFSAPAMPKSGHMANQHAKVAAAAVIRLLQGAPVNAAPVVMNTCYSFVTAEEAVHVASVHRYDAAEKTFKAVPGSGGVSAAASVAEGRFAQAWAENVWQDSLG